MMNIQCRFLMDLVIIIYIHPILPQQFIQVHLSHYSRLGQVQIDSHSSYPTPVVQQVHLSHYSRLGQVQIDLHSSYPDSCPSSSIGTSFSLFQVRLGLDRFTFILSCPSSSYKYIFLTIPGQVRFRQIHIHPILPQQFIQVYLAHYSRFGQVKINLHSSYPAPVVHTGIFCSLFQVRLGDLHSSYSAPVIGTSCSLDRYKIIITHFSLHENPLFLQSEYGSDLCSTRRKLSLGGFF